MAMSKAEILPEELIIAIFYRLPVKSIGRCRCLSKQWRNFLSDPKFIKLHFNRTKEEKLIIVTRHHELHTITFNHQNGEIDDAISRKLNFQHISENWVCIAGSCNGLVLVADFENVQFLINPTTLKFHKIPTFFPQGRDEHMYGLGYDVVSDDYKVVALSSNESNTVTCVDIYSVRKGLWEKLENSPYDHSLTDPAYGVLVNGALHWLAHKIHEDSSTIAAFDLSIDKFSEVPLPTDLQNYCFEYNLAALKGCLCISTSIYPHMDDTITFWIMKEYGVKESWTKFMITKPNLDVFCSTLLCSIGGGDDVILDVDAELVVYNIKENQLRDQMIDLTYFRYQVQTFMDSLVSPSFDNETEG